MAINLNSSRVKSNRVFPIQNWIGGISDYNKVGGSYLWGRGVDYRSEPSQLTLLPQAVPEGGNIFKGLVKWAEQVVGRTITLGTITNLISNYSFETNTTGWTLGADFTRSNSDSYLGTYSIKQVSTSGTVALTTASGSGLVVSAYADYQLIFYIKVALTSGQPAQLQILGGSLSGPNLLVNPISLDDTASQWVQVTANFNAGQYSSVFISIANQGGNLTAYYDNFSVLQINSIASFAYDDSGNIYKRYSDASWVSLGQIANSHGNGLAYYGEDDFLYLASDKSIGRYGPISSGTPTLVSDYLTSAGGVPTNTNSPLLVAASSQYFNKTTPTTIGGITGDIAMEIFVKPTSLPAIGSSMTLMGVWKDSSNKRAWKLDLYGISAVFGDGGSSSLTISVDTTEAPIDSACTGNALSQTLFATNASFAAGQIILIHQTQGTNAGQYEKNTIQSYTAGIITLTTPLMGSYTTGAQVRVVPQYTNVTINSGKTYSPKAWNGTTGGILCFACNGVLTVSGTISGAGLGFRGGVGVYGQGGTFGQTAYTGEGYTGLGSNTSTKNAQSPTNPGAGQGGGISQIGSTNGGGGGHSIAGSNSTELFNSPSLGGTSFDSADLTAGTLGGGGGGGGKWEINPNGSAAVANGGAGGAFIFITAVSIVVTGLITANGAAGLSGTYECGGGGGGGSIRLQVQTATLGTNLVTASGGAAAFRSGSDWGGNPVNSIYSGAGANGYVVLDYLTSFTGATIPTINAILDSTLVSTPITQARLGISNDGTSNEFLTQNLQNIAVGTWDRIQVSWNSLLSQATFLENGVVIGTTTGTKTAINGASGADFAIGSNFGASAYTNFFDGEVNDARVWNAQVTQAQFSAYNLQVLQGVATNLQGEWFVTATGNDLNANANNLTGQGSPTYTTDVPFAGATTRGDIDKTGGGTGNTYTLPTTLTEAQKQSFVPAQDPQKSLQVNINAKGTGNWTLVVHDGLNRNVATVTVTNANLVTSGQYEFVYGNVFSPVVGATYHFHLYSTVNDGSIKTTTSSDMTTAQFTTYFQYLQTDSYYHPIFQMGNLLAIGNGRYLAVLSASGGDQVGTYNAQGYNSRRLSFPSGWRVRCFAKWRGYYAIGCWKGPDIKAFEQGIVFLWDGYSLTYNDFFEIPEGGVNAMWGENGTLYLSAGYKGDILEYTGADSAVKVKRLPKIGKANYMEILPGAMNFYGALLRIGASYNSDSTTFERGVYTWGTLKSDYPKSLSYDYPISTGNRGTTVKIGALLPVGGSLLMFYQDGVNYGVNNINPSNPVQTSGTLEELIVDYGFVWKDKELQVIRADHLPLLTGENVDVKYKLNFESSWHSKGITGQLVGAQTTRLPLVSPTEQYHIGQIAIDLYATNGTSPTIIEHSQLTNLLIGEQDENENY